MSPNKKRLLVTGGASYDLLHLEDRTVESVGGVGLYTGMAAVRCGTDVSMVSPRPDPIPEPLQPVAARLREWIGPPVSPEQLPHFEISYRGGLTEYLNLSFRSAVLFSTAMLPVDLSKYDMMHITQKADISMQLAFIQACRQRGARRVSAGTCPVDAINHPEAVRAVIEQSDYFFMNDFEANAVFGDLNSVRTEPGKVLFVTLGAKGVRIIQGDRFTSIPAVPATELDPTGAGDTFCGATLAYLLQNQHPVIAARRAVALAAEMIQYVGPTALLSDDPPPDPIPDPRIQVNNRQVSKVVQQRAIRSGETPFPLIRAAS